MSDRVDRYTLYKICRHIDNRGEMKVRGIKEKFIEINI